MVVGGVHGGVAEDVRVGGVHNSMTKIEIINVSTRVIDQIVQINIENIPWEGKYFMRG